MFLNALVLNDFHRLHNNTMLQAQEIHSIGQHVDIHPGFGPGDLSFRQIFAM